MIISNLVFQVEFGNAVRRFYEKDFARKYPKGWVATKESIGDALQRVASFQGRNTLDFLKPLPDDSGLYKFDFPVAGTNTPAKSSGNRLIFSLSNTQKLVRVLLIYNKNHLPKNKSETQWIFEMVKEKYGLS